MTILTPINAIWFLMGTILGIIAGALPGIGASLTMALLIPITFYLPPERGLITLIAAWAAAVYGGSISSILINTPGTGGNVATTFDGFPMARNGKARVALGLSATSSMIGGIFGVATLIIPGIKANNFPAFLIAAAVLGLINAFIRPALWFLTAPLSVLTFGLFALVINALMIMLAAALVPNFEVKGFGSAFLGAVIMAIVGVIGFVLFAWLTDADISWSSYEYHSQTY